ncbi:hypothetical protein LMRF01_1069 [Listeria monocytogenes]|nr:hypothetical protein [Listeria monocytogenes]GKV59125.1 hypothetical protein LMRF01_1069 [Listeria monocytogenes]
MQKLIDEYKGALQEVNKVKANLQTKIDAKKTPSASSRAKKNYSRGARENSHVKTKQHY